MTGPSDQPGPDKQRSPLGLGPLETAIMQALWRAGGWVTVHHICDSMSYHRPVAYTTVATVTGILCGEGLADRELSRSGHPGRQAWWYRAAQPQNEHIGALIAALLDQCPDPGAALAHALTATSPATRVTLGQGAGTV